MKQLFRDIHLWLSLPLGILISIICLSGAALVFEQEITRTLQHPLYRITPPAEDASMLPPSELVRHIRAQVPDSLHLSSLQLSGNREETAFASFRETGRKQLAVHPYTGEVLGWTESYSFFQTMRKLHRWLLDPPASKGEKSVGKIVVGVTTLMMVVILLSGLICWIPRSKKAWKPRLSISFTKGWRRFWYDSHVATGFYATLFLLVMALTGLTWSFGWYRTAAYSLFGGGENPSQQTSAHASSQREKQKDKHKAAFDYHTWDNVLAYLHERYPSYKTITLNERIATIDPNPRSAMRKTDTATFLPGTGEIESIRPYADTPRQQTLKGWFYAFHTGSWGGMTTKILYFLAALLGGILPISGYYLWWKRKVKKSMPHKQKEEQA